MGIQDDQELEVRILRDKLTETEDKLEDVKRAVVETDLKIHAVMRRLLTANDVKGDRAMRVNILEQMNDLRRNVRGFFENVGIQIDATHDNGRPS